MLKEPKIPELFENKEVNCPDFLWKRQMKMESKIERLVENFLKDDNEFKKIGEESIEETLKEHCTGGN